MASKIKGLYEHIVNEFAGSSALERKVQTHIGTLVTQAYHQSMASDESYCLKFNLPIMQVKQLFKMLSLDPKDVEKKFRADWRLLIAAS